MEVAEGTERTEGEKFDESEGVTGGGKGANEKPGVYLAEDSYIVAFSN